MSSKFNVGRWAPFVAASLSFLFYWASLPPSWIGWAAFLVPAVWAATVFNPDFNVFVERNGKNALIAQNSEKSEAGKKRRLRAIRRLARFFGRVFFGGEYRQYWTAAFCFWAATVVWISYPHPATTLGWLAAAAYLAIYFPLFVAITRALAGFSTRETAESDAATAEVAEVGQSGEDGETAQAGQDEENAAMGKTAPTLALKVRQTAQVAQFAKAGQKQGKTQFAKTARQREKTRIAETGRDRGNAQGAGTAQRAKRFGLPFWLAAPVAWTAVEWLRNRVLGGFSFAGLSHSLCDFPQFIQIAEPFGEYGVGAAVVAIGTLLGTAVAAAVSINCANKKSAEISENCANEAEAAVSETCANEAEAAVSINCANKKSAAASENCGNKKESVVGRIRANGEKTANGAKWRRVALSLAGAVAVFGAVVGFGVRRLAFFDAAERSAVESGAVPCRVALLQDGTTYRFPVPDWQNTQVAETYLALAAEAARSQTPFDVVVWPESCFDVFGDEQTTAVAASGANGGKTAVSASGTNGGKTAVSANGVNGGDSGNAAAEVERLARAEKSRALARSRRDAARLTERLGASAILGTTALLVDVDAGDETTVFNAAVFAPRLDAATVAALGGEYVDFNAADSSSDGKTGEIGGTGGIGAATKTESWGKYVDWKTPASTAPNDPNPAIFRLYGKRRLVIFGEYVPGADWLPDWFPLKAVCADFSLARGAGPVVFPVVRRGVAAENGEIDQNNQLGQVEQIGQIGQVGQIERIGQTDQVDQINQIGPVNQVNQFGRVERVSKVGGGGEVGQNKGNTQNAQVEPLLFAPHICFESSIPHYVKEQVRELTAVGAEPDVLVCLSNDGWFRNGSQTDGHLATQVFRAVENRKPVVAATHGGFSAHIDQAGRVRSRGARGATEVVAAEVLPVDCARLGKGTLLGGRDLAETFALACVVLGLGALVVRKVGGRREKCES